MAPSCVFSHQDLWFISREGFDDASCISWWRGQLRDASSPYSDSPWPHQCSLLMHSPDDLQLLRNPEINQIFFLKSFLVIIVNSYLGVDLKPISPYQKNQSIFSVMPSTYTACSILSEINKASEMLCIVWPYHFLHSSLHRKVEWFNPRNNHKTAAELGEKCGSFTGRTHHVSRKWQANIFVFLVFFFSP